MRTDEFPNEKKPMRVQAQLPEDIFAKLCKLALRDRVPLAQEVLWACVRWTDEDGRTGQ